MKGELQNNLQDKYRRVTLTKKEVATELGLSLRTIDSMIKDGSVLPKPLKIGNGKNAPVRFNIIDIANFISDVMDDNKKMKYIDDMEFLEYEGSDTEEQE